jgi:hypothetical protein
MKGIAVSLAAAAASDDDSASISPISVPSILLLLSDVILSDERLRVRSDEGDFG